MELDAQDNLLNAKISQAHQANKGWQLHFPFCEGDCVVLSIANRRHEYKTGDGPRAAKFMLCFDGPYQVISTDEHHSTFTLDMPHHSNLFPVFHTSEVHMFKENDNSLFSLHALHPPPPVTIDNQQEFFIDKIVDE
jgi:hypothetical protein